MRLCEAVRGGVAAALAVAAITAALAACQPMPHPFARDESARDNPLLTLPDRNGIVVLDVDGVPEAVSRAAAAAMADELLRRNVPAATEGGNRGSFFIQGRVTSRAVNGARRELSLTWDLFDRTGRIVGSEKASRHAQASAALGDVIVGLARASAGGVAALVQDGEPSRRIDAAKTASLHVLPVAGAPGDGATILRHAMMNALRRASLKVDRDIRDGSLVIAGRMAVAPVRQGRREVEIVWSVLRPDGSEVGNLKQQNTVDATALDGDWDDLAVIVAESAAGGIVDMLHRLTPEALRGERSTTR